MKKLLVLTLVLAMASLASATLSLAVDGSTVTVVASDGQVGVTSLWIGLNTQTDGLGADVLETDVSWVSGIDEDAAGTGAVVSMAAYGNQWNLMDWPTPSAAGSITDGVWFTFVMDVQNVPSAGYIVLQDNNYATLDAVQIVPEPATLALLGLGGLLLRRRK